LPVLSEIANVAQSNSHRPRGSVQGVLTQAPSSATLYVSSTSSAPTAGCADSLNPCSTIQAGITAAASYASTAVTVDVAAGTYVENDTITMPIGVTLTLQGASTGSTIADGGGTGTVFTINGGTVNIDGFTIQNADGNSGGVYNAVGTTVALTDDTISNNYANSGGGVYNAGTATLTNDTLSNNEASDFGGALYNSGSATLTNDTFSSDAAYGGDDISNGGIVTVANSIFVGPSYWLSLCSGTVTDGGYNVASDNSCGFGSTSVSSSSSINLASALAANGSSGPQTFAIGVDSSAYEEVPLASCSVTTDERGVARPGVTGQPTGDVYCDAGAFEAQSNDSVPDVLAFTSNSGSTDYPHHTTYTTPSATGTTGDAGIISYSLDGSSSASCTVAGSSGAISAIGGTGTCVVDATQAQSGVYEQGTATFTLTITQSAKPPRAYAVTYALGGGTGTVPTQASEPSGARFRVASAAGITRSGYTFTGWSDGAATYHAGATYTVRSGGVTFTAQWKLASPKPVAHRSCVVHFSEGSSRLTARDMAAVAAFVALFKSSGQSSLTVIGYVNATGSRISNQGLGLRRAHSVATALRKRFQALGLTSVRIRVVDGGVSRTSKTLSMNRKAVVTS